MHSAQEILHLAAIGDDWLHLAADFWVIEQLIEFVWCWKDNCSVQWLALG